MSEGPFYKNILRNMYWLNNFWSESCLSQDTYQVSLSHVQLSKPVSIPHLLQEHPGLCKIEACSLTWSRLEDNLNACRHGSCLAYAGSWTASDVAQNPGHTKQVSVDVWASWRGGQWRGQGRDVWVGYGSKHSMTATRKARRSQPTLADKQQWSDTQVRHWPIVLLPSETVSLRAPTFGMQLAGVNEVNLVQGDGQPLKSPLPENK